MDQTLAERVDLDQTRVDCLVELSKLGDQTDIALANILVGVGAADYTWESTHGSDAGSKAVDHAAVPSLWVRIIADNAGIALLQVFLARRLDDHVGLRTEARDAISGRTL